MWTLFHAVANWVTSNPFGHKAIGWRSVSRVGVIEDLSIHRIGPRPTTMRKTSVPTCTTRTSQRTRRWLQVGLRQDAALGRRLTCGRSSRAAGRS